MRHSPERVADVACGVFGIVRHQLYDRNADGSLMRDIESVRRRSLVIKAVRRIAGASFPEMSGMFCKASHSSIFSSWESDAATDQEQALFESTVRNLLRAYEPKPPKMKPVERDTRCDGVWFSPACREEQEQNGTH